MLRFFCREPAPLQKQERSALGTWAVAPDCNARHVATLEWLKRALRWLSNTPPSVRSIVPERKVMDLCPWIKWHRRCYHGALCVSINHFQSPRPQEPGRTTGTRPPWPNSVWSSGLVPHPHPHCKQILMDSAVATVPLTVPDVIKLYML